MSKLKNIVVNALDALKAENIQVLDVTGLTLITDHMIIASGNSHRHTQAIAKHVLHEVKQHALPTLGIEGESIGEWILLDFGDAIVHIMLTNTREFYRLEKLWTQPTTAEAQHTFAV